MLFVPARCCGIICCPQMVGIKTFARSQRLRWERGLAKLQLGETRSWSFGRLGSQAGAWEPAGT
jgi:hypothetical protein